MFQLKRYSLRPFRLSNLVATRLKLSTFNHDSIPKPESTSVPIRGVIEQPMHSSIFQPYDVVVVGGGHAGCEGR